MFWNMTAAPSCCSPIGSIDHLRAPPEKVRPPAEADDRLELTQPASVRLRLCVRRPRALLRPSARSWSTSSGLPEAQLTVGGPMSPNFNRCGRRARGPWPRSS